jgi:hypothetical protein
MNVSRSTNVSSRVSLSPVLAAATAALWLGVGSVATPTAAAAAGDAGYIHGRLTTRDGVTYEGRLRWDDEEASWSDFFNSSKAENPWFDEVPRRVRRSRGESITLFGIEIARRSSDEGRQFVARFGDITKLRVDRGDEATVFMKSGTRFEVDGGSNDVESAVIVYDSKVGEIQVPWRRIDTIEFSAGGDDAAAPARLYGTVETSSGTFTGTIQWDQHECLASDKLDGESDDSDVSLVMGNLKSIERRGRRASLVTLKNGSTMELSGTNDVNDENRGIYVDDPRFGRVLIRWRAFEKVTFTDGKPAAYADYAPGKPLRGRVTDSDGKVHAGRLAYDLDEAETWELLNGWHDDIEYSIPFGMIASVTPIDGDESKVVLKNGQEIRLEGQTDVGGDNLGVLIIPGEDATKNVYVPWDDVAKVEID